MTLCSLLDVSLPKTNLREFVRECVACRHVWVYWFERERESEWVGGCACICVYVCLRENGCGYQYMCVCESVCVKESNVYFTCCVRCSVPPYLRRALTAAIRCVKGVTSQTTMALVANPSTARNLRMKTSSCHIQQQVSVLLHCVWLGTLLWLTDLPTFPISP